MLITIKPKIKGDKMLKLIEKINEDQRELRSDLYKLEIAIKEMEFEEVGDAEESPTQD